MRIMLLSFVVTAVIMALTIWAWAAPEVGALQRLVLGSVPIVISVVITWLAWKDA